MLNKEDLKKIKLIIWDLDDTLWNGTISEGECIIPEQNIKLVRLLCERGILNSICSKNDESVTVEKLKEFGISDYFVFNSINWENKGPRIKSMIDSMALRQENVLFIDDNEHNLGEAKHYCPRIMVESPHIISVLVACVNELGKEDTQLSRLEQYKTLEKKIVDKSEYSDEESFLKESDIKVYIGADCEDNFDRIYELVHRTNQLNYTKRRSSKEELLDCIRNLENECRYIMVKDKYGEYGLVGFYALDKRQRHLIHYLFSCRTLGMHIEQYIYQILKYPNISVDGSVTVELLPESNIKYIEQISNKKIFSEKKTRSKGKIVFRGPCDLDSVIAYLGNKNIEKEFRYVNKNGDLVSNGSHPAILENIIMQKNGDNTSLFEPDVYNTRIFDSENCLVVLSTLLCAYLGEYKCLENNEIIVFGEWKYDATDDKDQDAFLESRAWSGFVSLTKADFKRFEKNHEYIGRISAEDMAKRYVRIIRHFSPKTRVCLLLGSEKECKKERYESLKGAEMYYRDLNTFLKKELSEFKNVDMINITDFVANEGCYVDSIDHFSREVYFALASKLSSLYPTLLSARKITLQSIFGYVKHILRNILKFLRILG